MGSAFCKSLFHCVRGLSSFGNRSELRVDCFAEAGGFLEEDRAIGLFEDGRGGRETEEDCPSRDFCDVDLTLFLSTDEGEGASTFIGEYVFLKQVGTGESTFIGENTFRWLL